MSMLPSASDVKDSTRVKSCREWAVEGHDDMKTQGPENRLFDSQGNDDRPLRHDQEREDLFSKWKLFGRSREQEAVKEAYQRVKEGSQYREFVVITGASGIGKTSLATIVRETSQEDWGHFVHGKFDHLQRPEPHAAFAEAFSGFVACTIGRGEQEIKRVRRAIGKAVGSEGRVLTDMVPQMEGILPPQEEKLETVNHKLEAVNRFKFVNRAFLRAVSSPEHPFVILLDDLHWADDSSLDLLVTLLHDRKAKGCLFIGTFRNDEMASKKLIKVLSQLNGDLVKVTVVELQGLKPLDVRCMMMHLMRCEEGVAKPLSDFMYNQTLGNPYHIREKLLYLKACEYLAFNDRHGCWEWDLEEIRCKLTSNKEVIQRKLTSLPVAVTQMLKISCCLGTKLDEDILRHLMSEPVCHYLEIAAKADLIAMDHWHSGYEFTHDEVKVATYNLIPEHDRESFHSNIGRSLWASLGADEVDKYVFVVIGQFMLGNGQYSGLRERKEIALLFLRAGQRAVSMSSFQAAYNYLLRGIECLGESRWRHCYSLSLRLYNAAAEVAYCIGHLSSVETLVSEVLKNARVPDDTFRSQATRVYALGGSGRQAEAIEVGLGILKSLEVTFPSRLAMSDVSRELRKIRKTLKKYTFESILLLPNMTNPRQLAAMEVLNLLFIYAFMARFELAPMIGFAMVRLTLDHGLSAMSCTGFVMYAMCLCGFGEDIDEGFRYGELSISMLEKFKGPTWLVRLSVGYYGCVHAWKRPVQESLLPLKQAHRAGLESGDIEFAMLAANIYTWSQFDLCPLPKLDAEIQEFADLMDLHGQVTNRIVIKPIWQVVRNLIGRAAGDVCELNGDVMQECEMGLWLTSNPNLFVWSQYYRMLLLFMFGRNKEALALCETCRPIVDHPFGAIDVASVLLIETLTCLVEARRSSKSIPLSFIKKRIDKVRSWARHAPYNFLGTLFLLEAELSVLNRDHDTACSKYVCAIALNKESGSMMKAALSNERFGKYCAERGQKPDAKKYTDEALKLYETWGAMAKVHDLKDEVRFVNFAD